MSLAGKKIILGITGSIAAYKAAMLVRLLVREGAEVKCLMTPLAKQFIAPLTLATLCGEPVPVEFFDPENGQWNSHVRLGLWADALVVAPATANTLGKMAGGIADNLLLTTYLSAKCPVFVSPAMDLDMYAHPATQRNLRTLRNDGVEVIEPREGELASGLTGKGRMEEPEGIVACLRAYFERDKGPLAGRKVLVTAGGTVEPIDAVRFISNYSSGRMGYALAEAFAARGAEVILVRGRVDDPSRALCPGITTVPVKTAADMYEAAMRHFPETDIAVLAAAVADFTPERPAEGKLKKEAGRPAPVLHLTETRDIAAALGSVKRPGQLTVGFALEAEDEEANALRKLERKQFDLIVLNSLRDEGAGFGTDTNKVTLFYRDGRRQAFPLKSKAGVAADIAGAVAELAAGR